MALSSVVIYVPSVYLSQKPARKNWMLWGHIRNAVGLLGGWAATSRERLSFSCDRS
jgi:hypothetical protein